MEAQTSTVTSSANDCTPVAESQVSESQAQTPFPGPTQATQMDVDPQSEASTDSTNPLPSQTDGKRKRPSRVRDVSPRSLSEIANGYELLSSVLGGLLAHEAIYKAGDGELHGDINPNSLVILDHPGDETPWDSPASSFGGMIYWEPPISIQTMRKVGNPDRPQPPPDRRPRYMPPFGYKWYSG